MSNRISFIALFLFIQFGLFAQELQWKVGLNYFFDNTEYAKSKLTKDQTMTGVHFSPEIGVSWDSAHSVYVGTDLLKISGSLNTVDAVHPIAYYQYKTPKAIFYAGAFPRCQVLSNYFDLFFQDSINYYRPTLQGLFWQVGQSKSYFNLWLDWTGYQTAINRETFFVGISAHKDYRYLFADFQSYMYHFANTRPSNPAFNVCDNVLAHLSLGVNYSNPQGLDTLLLAVGVLAGIERDRGMENGTRTPIGAVVRCNVEYSGFGTQNMLYLGDPRMSFYEKYGAAFYWNNPFLRSNYYLESKWYLNVIRNRAVQGKLSLNLHYSEGKVMYEQVFLLSASLNSQSKNKEKLKSYSWNRWFK